MSLSSTVRHVVDELCGATTTPISALHVEKKIRDDYADLLEEEGDRLVGESLRRSIKAALTESNKRAQLSINGLDLPRTLTRHLGGEQYEYIPLRIARVADLDDDEKVKGQNVQRVVDEFEDVVERNNAIRAASKSPDEPLLDVVERLVGDEGAA